MPRQRLFAPLSPSFLSENVAESITEAILSGKIRPGERLNENQLASEFRVSRTPVREALHELQEQGLVEANPRRGVSVVSLQHDDIRKIISLRLPLEAEALYLCRENLNAVAEKKLLQLVERMESMEPEPLSQTIRLDLQFHRTVWELTGNQYLCRILKSITTPLFAHAVITRPYSSQTLVVLASHRPLVEFVQGKRSESAEEMMLTHLKLGWTDAVPFSRRLVGLTAGEGPKERAADASI